MVQNYRSNRLFIGSCFALIVTAITFPIRARLEEIFSTQYGLTGEEIGWAFGPAFWGFTLAMFFGGVLIDVVGTKNILRLAFVGHFAGFIFLLLAKDKTMLFTANVFIGLANGCVEAACNPLITTIYSKSKTEMLNRFHMWFPGGLIIGALLALLLIDTMGFMWQILVGALFIPLFIYGYLFWGKVIPKTERVTKGISFKGMLKNISAPITIFVLIGLMILSAAIPAMAIDFYSSSTYIVLSIIVVAIIVESKVINKASLLFPFLLLCMFLTAGSELGMTQFINDFIKNNGVSPMVVFLVISTIMAIGRSSAGLLIHRLNASEILLGSAFLTAGSLYLLSVAEGPVNTILAASMFALGVCYFWPTMLGFLSENIPGSGALGLSIIGGAGFVATSVALPLMGKSIDTVGPEVTLKYMSVLPTILVVLFIGLRIYIKRRQAREVD